MKNERYMMEQHIVPYFGNQMMSEITAGQIIHIFDMDGAYIDNSHIIEGETKQIFYTTDNISCKDVEKVKRRNEGGRTVGSGRVASIIE